MLTKNLLLLAAALGTLVIGTSPASAQAQAEGQAQTGVVNPEAAASARISPGVEEESEQEIPLGEVPEAVIDAAKGALETEPEEAYLVTLMDGQQVYEIEATKDGEERAVYVTAAGEIVEREQEEEEKE